MVILRISLERRIDEVELWARLASDHEQEPAVVPNLVGFEIFHRQFVHELKLNIEGSVNGKEGFISVLPIRAQVNLGHPHRGNSVRTMLNSGLDLIE